MGLTDQQIVNEILINMLAGVLSGIVAHIAYQMHIIVKLRYLIVAFVALSVTLPYVILFLKGYPLGEIPAEQGARYIEEFGLSVEFVVCSYGTFRLGEWLIKRR